jgi:hypothetical protein
MVTLTNIPLDVPTNTRRVAAAPQGELASVVPPTSPRTGADNSTPTVLQAPHSKATTYAIARTACGLPTGIPVSNTADAAASAAILQPRRLTVYLIDDESP